jgi:hypothetical protein
MNTTKALSCIVIQMSLCLSLLFLPTEVSAQESQGGFTVQMGPQQSVGFGVDLGHAILLFGGNLDFDWFEGSTKVFRITPQAGLKFFVGERRTVSPYFHGWVSKVLLIKDDFDESPAPTTLGGALGLEYALTKNLNIGGEVGLRIWRDSREDSSGARIFPDGTISRNISQTSLFSYHSIILRYTF